MHNVEQIKTAPEVAPRLEQGDDFARIKLLSERLEARAEFEAQVEAFWHERLRGAHASLQRTRRFVFALVLASFGLVVWAGFATTVGWEEVKAAAAKTDLRGTVLLLYERGAVLVSRS